MMGDSMRSQAAMLPAYLAMGLAALAAMMSGPVPRLGDIDGAMLWLLTAEAAAVDMPPADVAEQMPFAGP